MDLNTYTSLSDDQRQQVDLWLDDEGWLDRNVVAYQLLDSGWVTFTYLKTDSQGRAVLDSDGIVHESSTATVSSAPPLV